MNIVTEQTLDSPFFKIRRASRFTTFDTSGYWSYPAFLVDRGGKISWLYLVAPTASSRSVKGHAIFKPKALVVTLPNSSVVVRYENFRTGRDPTPTLSWDKPLALLPHQSVAHLPKLELAKRERLLLRECVEAGDKFLRMGKLPEPFRHEYLMLQHPFFLPWLRQLCPAFIAALEIKADGE